MDSQGHWHVDHSVIIDKEEKFQETGKRMRPVITIDIGETVSIVKYNGEQVTATFTSVERNRVTLTPQENGVYLELAESVELKRANGESVRAQVWDNRKGKIILRTLPLL